MLNTRKKWSYHSDVLNAVSVTFFCNGVGGMNVVAFEGSFHWKTELSNRNSLALIGRHSYPLP
jgi:hypothetical protein